MTMETEMPEEPIFSFEEWMREDKLPPVFPSSQSSVSSEALVSQHLISEVCDQNPWPFGERYPHELDSAGSTSTYNFVNSSLALSPISIPRSPAEDCSFYLPSTSSSPESQGLSHDEFEDKEDKDDGAGEDLSGEFIGSLSERDFQLYLDDLKADDEGLNSEPFSQVDFLEPNQQIRQETPSPHESYIPMSPSSGYLTSHNITFNSSSLYPAAADSEYLTEMAPLEVDNFHYETKPQELPPLTSTPPPQLPVFTHAQEESKPILVEPATLIVKNDPDMHTIPDNSPQIDAAALIQEPSSSTSTPVKSQRNSTKRNAVQKKVPISRGRKRKFDGDDDKKKDQNKEAARRYREKKREEETQNEELLRGVKEENEKLKKEVDGLVNQHRIYLDLMKDFLERRKAAAKSSNNRLLSN